MVYTDNNMETQEQLAEWLERTLEEGDYSQRGFAREVGISEGTVRRIRKHHRTSEDTLRKLSKATGVPLARLHKMNLDLLPENSGKRREIVAKIMEALTGLQDENLMRIYYIIHTIEQMQPDDS